MLDSKIGMIGLPANDVYEEKIRVILHEGNTTHIPICVVGHNSDINVFDGLRIS